MTTQDDSSWLRDFSGDVAYSNGERLEKIADRLEALQAENKRLREALETVDSHLTNLQPHLASVKENYGELAVAFIDPHVDCALEAARAALNQKE